MIKLTEPQEITPYLWGHPDEARPHLVGLALQQRFNDTRGLTLPAKQKPQALARCGSPGSKI
jgi:hypothetical protein